jgi:hypothetical protein
MDAPFLHRPSATTLKVFASICSWLAIWEAKPASAAESSPGVEVIRGPYLQSGTTTNIIVRWRTDAPTDSKVKFGLASWALIWTALDPNDVTDHSVTLTNLSPDTKYFYSIGTSDFVLAGGSDHYFITAPAKPKPTRIWAIGDSGTASQFSFGSWEVRDAYRTFAEGRETDVWLMLGDNAYYSGTDDEYQTAVFETYPGVLRCNSLWSTIGNHDAVFPSVYFDIFSLPTDGRAGGLASGSEHYYSFDYSDIHFVCLDSELSDKSPGGPMLTWLEADLAANSKFWTIAFWHSPPYNFGTHNSDRLDDTYGNLVGMRERVVPVLESYGVDLVLCGHSHSYERSFLLNGHYGYSGTLTPQMIKDSGDGRPDGTGPYRKGTLGPGPEEGAVYVVAGSSGWVTGDIWTLTAYQHPAMFIKLKELGSMVIDVNSNRLDAKFLRETGAIDDYFTIIKGGGPEHFRVAEFNVQDGLIMARWHSVAGSIYRIQRTANLERPEWNDVSHNIEATGPSTTWSGFIEDAEKSFFRVRKVD